MNIDLSTMDVWTLEDDFTPPAFLRSLRVILQDGDVIAFGAYEPSERLLGSPLIAGATTGDAGTIYNVCFHANRREHPRGRSFELIVSQAILDELVLEAQRPDGQRDKPLFFNHFAAYRRGCPVVPLLDFHDAFDGGILTLSELYAEGAVKAFAAGLPSAYVRQRNPANYPSDAGEDES